MNLVEQQSSHQQNWVCWKEKEMLKPRNQWTDSLVTLSIGSHHGFDDSLLPVAPRLHVWSSAPSRRLKNSSRIWSTQILTSDVECVGGAATEILLLRDSRCEIGSSFVLFRRRWTGRRVVSFETGSCRRAATNHFENNCLFSFNHKQQRSVKTRSVSRLNLLLWICVVENVVTFFHDECLMCFSWNLLVVWFGGYY